MELKMNARFWIKTEKGPFLGFGRVELLEKIEDSVTLSKAASAINMSFKHVDHLVDSMNSKTSIPLVEKHAGGGGTFLTEEGKKAIILFRQMEMDVRGFMEKASSGLAFSYF